MDPVTLAAIGMAATAAGGAVKTYGELQEGAAGAAKARYQQAVALQNQQFETEIGERKTAELGLRQGARMGEIRTKLASSGLDVTRGSALSTQESQAGINRIEQQDVRYNAARRAFQEGQQADIYGFAAKQATRASKIAAAGTILGTTAAVAGKWYQGQTYGLTPGGSGGGSLTGDLTDEDLMAAGIA